MYINLCGLDRGYNGLGANTIWGNYTITPRKGLLGSDGCR